MTRAMRRENYPLTVRLARGRVIHMARSRPDSDALLTACGKSGRPALPWPSPSSATCQACINQPWSQDQRARPA